ncbi:MAG TPA: helix-turn-helix domain-containing protein [Fimbriimonas sp.]|nr:helix-turn-helix domain-containing protein [Fimbriimonas sp.]
MRISSKTIIEAVAEVTGISVADIKGGSKMLPISRARQLAIYVMKVHNGDSHKFIARDLKLGDHTGSVYGFQKIGRLMESDADTQLTVSLIMRKLDYWTNPTGNKTLLAAEEVA